ncbi:hypothetical protein FRX31_031176 [Thalictrum thalictroides]|uniref:Uncharacterized protein n=1 Tax=Thalictrum thalictroides TaxID=46969 RepID=A0A7J6V2I3_THATH|nr:hypothetical protein FRX31_031176 [Thalictrum thalictroides]
MSSSLQNEYIIFKLVNAPANAKRPSSSNQYKYIYHIRLHSIIPNKDRSHLANHSQGFKELISLFSLLVPHTKNLSLLNTLDPPNTWIHSTKLLQKNLSNED